MTNSAGVGQTVGQLFDYVSVQTTSPLFHIVSNDQSALPGDGLYRAVLGTVSAVQAVLLQDAVWFSGAMHCWGQTDAHFPQPVQRSVIL